MTLLRSYMLELRTPANREKLSELVRQIERLLNDVTTKPKGIGERTAPLRKVSEMLKITSMTNQPASNRTSQSLEQPTPHPETRSPIAEMPKNKADFVRLFFSGPDAVFNWVQSAASRFDTISRPVRDPMTGKPTSKLSEDLADASHRRQASLSTTKTSIPRLHGERVGTCVRNAKASFLRSTPGGLKGGCICLKNDIAIAATFPKAREARDEDGVC